MTLFLRVAGLWYLACWLLPLDLFFGKVNGYSSIASPIDSIVFFVATLALAWLLAFVLKGKLLDSLIERMLSFSTKHSRLIVLFLLVILFLSLLLSANLVFNRQPHLVDSVVQLFQAKIFAVGQLSGSVPPYQAFFMTQHMLIDSAGWYSQYPPLHSFFLMIGVLFGASYVVPVILGTITAVLMWLFVRRVFGLQAGLITVVLLVTSPFFIFMSSSHMNHVTMLFLVSLFLWAFAEWENSQNRGYLLLIGLAASASLLVRPLTSIALFLPYILPALKRVYKEKLYFDFILTLFLVSGVGAVLLWYNYSTTGDAFLPGYIKLWGVSHGLGFHESPWGDLHTPMIGLENEFMEQKLLQQMLMEWSFPALVPIGLFLLGTSAKPIWVSRLVMSALLLPCFYFFYWHRDMFLGPRFMYESIAMLFPLLGVSILTLYQKSKTTFFTLFGILRPVAVSQIIVFTIFCGYLFSFTQTIPDRVSRYQYSLASFKKDLTQEAKMQGLEKGIIFIKVSWGNRLFAEMRGQGLPPALVQKAYLRVDHCLLFETLQQARSENWALEKYQDKVVSFLRTEPKAKKRRLNDDPTLRLADGRRLGVLCQDEIDYDNSGPFTIYTPYFKENQPNLGPPFVIARDLRQKNELLMKHWPDLPGYIYSDGVFQVLEPKNN